LVAQDELLGLDDFFHGRMPSPNSKHEHDAGDARQREPSPSTSHSIKPTAFFFDSIEAVGQRCHWF
jgi:hypothetical protein